MKYRDGTQVKVGDKVNIDGFFTGVVAISFDDAEALDGYDIADWDENSGVLVSFENGSRLQIVQSDDDGNGPAMIEKSQLIQP